MTIHVYARYWCTGKTVLLMKFHCRSSAEAFVVQMQHRFRADIFVKGGDI